MAKKSNSKKGNRIPIIMEPLKWDKENETKDEFADRAVDQILRGWAAAIEAKKKRDELEGDQKKSDT